MVADADEETGTEDEPPTQARTQDGVQDQPAGGSSKRRRRRRGGRSHGDRPQGQQPRQPTPTHNIQAQPPEATIDIIADATPVDNAGAEANTGSASPQANQPGATKRKRRRRRGKRGGGGHANGAPDARHVEANQPFTATSNGFDRFGVPDEIDTTPREEPAREPVIERSDPETPVAMPNAASSPVWSLTAEQNENEVRPVEIAVKPMEADVSEKTPEPVSSQPAGPPKKGWWQRTFRTDS
jgi:ribonuclease E